MYDILVTLVFIIVVFSYGVKNLSGGPVHFFGSHIITKFISITNTKQASSKAARGPETKHHQ